MCNIGVGFLRRSRVCLEDQKAPDMPDTFTYDPIIPTPSYRGNVCSAANTIPGNGGALDQRQMEQRQDIARAVSHGNR